MGFQLHTPRLFLREMTPDDASNVYLLNLDEEVIRYTGDVPFEDVESARNFLLQYKDFEIHGIGRWTVEDLQGTFLGWCGLKKNDNGEVDLGYRLMKKYWGNGFATEAANACVEYGLKQLHLNYVIGKVVKANTASVNVLEKIGFKYWKEDQCARWTDALVYRKDNAN